MTAGYWGADAPSATVPVATSNAFAALGDMAAAAGSEQLLALSGQPLMQPMPGAFGYDWQQQQQLVPPFMWHPPPPPPPPPAAAAAAEEEAAVPAAVAAACQRRRPLEELLFEETDAAMMSRCVRIT